MYFPGDPLFAYEPGVAVHPDEKSRQRLISNFDLETTKPEWALGYRFDIVRAAAMPRRSTRPREPSMSLGLTHRKLLDLICTSV